MGVSEWNNHHIAVLQAGLSSCFAIGVKKEARSVFYYHLNRLKAADRYANGKGRLN